MNKTTYNSRLIFFLFPFSFFFLTSCSVQRKIERSAEAMVLSTPAFKAAHTGISIFEPATNSYWYNYQGDKYFVPASNVKIPTCYAAMKYLGDSLTGFYIKDSADVLFIRPAGDPSFLHPDFPNQPFFQYLRSVQKDIRIMSAQGNRVTEYGSGWSWDDYQEAYLAERAEMPVYGNVIHFELKEDQLHVTPPIMRRPYMEEPMIQLLGLGKNFKVSRSRDENKFRFWRSDAAFTRKDIPFKTKGLNSGTMELLMDTLHRSFPQLNYGISADFSGYRIVRSQPTDSLLKPMMHRSDNFFAEQSLLMVSNEKLGLMNDAKIIDTLLKTDLKDLPQKPRWADGSGLSRYNLFTPQSLVAILNKMKNEFGMERLKVILPTGGEGTISNYFKADSGYIFGKTGTLSGVVAFSGFLYTRKGKLLIFSTLVNNHQAAATDIRRAVEQFLQKLRADY